MSEWISDRTPEHMEDVLLLCEVRPSGCKYQCVGYFAEADKEECGASEEVSSTYSEEDDCYYLASGYYERVQNWDDFGSITIGDFVIGWMPLPEPPKEETT